VGGDQGIYLRNRGDVLGHPKNQEEKKAYRYSNRTNHIRGGVLNIEAERAFRCNRRFFANNSSGGTSPCLVPKSFW
jgi:hypothetical protein